MGFILTAITSAAGWVAVLIEALCVTAGLYILCDLAEEHASLMNKILTRSVYTMCILYFLLILDGSLPIKNAFCGIICHLIFLPLLQTFPYFEPISLKSFAALGATLLNHFLWFNYFVKGSRNYTYKYGYDDDDARMDLLNSTRKIIGFFLIFVWLVPLGFFVSMTDVDESLPGGAGMGAQYQSSSSKRKRRSFFGGIMDFVMGKKADSMHH